MNKLRILIDKPLYDDLTPYLTGIRDCLNYIENVDYIDKDEFLELVKNEIEKLEANNEDKVGV